MSEPRTKSLAAIRAKAASAPTPEQLTAVNAYTLREMTAEQIVVREYVLAHNAIDRDKECFADDLLADFARTLPGKGVFSEGHPGGWNGTGAPPEGKVFAATTERMTHDAARALLRAPGLVFPPDTQDAVVVKASAYFVKTPENESFLLKTDAGIGCDVSIGFAANDIVRLKDGAMELNAWRWLGPGEALELSHVWLGAQPGARATKSAHREERTMDPKEKALADMTADRDTQKAAAEGNAKAATTLAGIKTALGDDAALLESPAALAKAVKDGKAHRKSLIDALVTHDRQSGLCGDDDEAVKKHAADYEGLATDHLQRMLGLAEKRANAPVTRSQVKPGDPNAGNPNGPAGAGKSAFLDNPAIAG